MHALKNCYSMHISGIIFSIVNRFQLFSCGKKIQNLQDTIRIGKKKMHLLKGDIDVFSYFSLIFGNSIF
jgi:hypothetical protein